MDSDPQEDSLSQLLDYNEKLIQRILELQNQLKEKEKDQTVDEIDEMEEKRRDLLQKIETML